MSRPTPPEHSAYFDREGATLGLTLMGHDVSCTVLDSTGVPVLVAEEERYSKLKKGSFAPSLRWVYEVLAEAQVAPARVRHVAFANVPALMERRPRETRAGLPRFGHAKSCEALARTLVLGLGDVDEVSWVRHHQCHAASAFLPSPFASAAVITVDGMGEDETATIWMGEGVTLVRLLSIRHPHSLGYLYQAIAQWAGMTGAEREGKLMGLASTGTPELLEVLRKHFLEPRPDGTFALAPELAAARCDNAAWIAHCERYFGPRRQADGPLEDHHRNVASSVQTLLEETLLGFLGLAARLTGASNACLAGGVFMNSAANGRLRREGPFEELWVQPMASDNGLSLGAALWSFVRRRPALDRWRMTTPFLGTEATDGAVRKLLIQHGISARLSDDVAVETASLLSAGRLVGWVQGRSEVGARSLGHRSILADPRDARTKDRLNAAIKQREGWRPFAPMVLEEEAHELFDDARESPFMMFVTTAREGAPIAATLHVDRTARVQTVHPDFDTLLHKLLLAFRERTGVGALLNTSFNVRGEPIARTVDDAYRIFVGTGMDALVLGNYILEKPTFPAWSGVPVAAAPPRVELAIQAVNAARGAACLAIVSLGSRELAEAARRTLVTSGRRVILLSPPSSSLSYPLVFESCVTDRGEPVPIAGLVEFDLVIVLLPTWAELASELAPNILAPFVQLSRTDRTRLLLCDGAGGVVDLDALQEEWERSGARGAVSDLEHHWVTRGSA